MFFKVNDQNVRAMMLSNSVPSAGNGHFDAIMADFGVMD